MNRGLPAGLVDAVLEGLGLEGAPAPDLAGLRRLYGAWCERVPFDNVVKRLHLAEGWPGRLPGSTGTDFFQTWIEYRAGGTCWAGNGALFELCRELGFRVERGLATMLVSPETAPNHGTVIASVPEGRFAIDASILGGEPLRLPDRPLGGGDGGAGARGLAWIEAGAGGTIIWWRTLRAPDGFACRIERIGLDPEEWDARHQRTAAWSPFNYAACARILRQGRAVGLTQGQRYTIEPGGPVAAEPVEGDRRTRHLSDEIGIDRNLVDRLPADRATPPAPTPS